LSSWSTRVEQRPIHQDPSFAFAIPILGSAMAVSHSGDLERQEIPAILFAIGA
jgi:hypothetical protein